MESINLYIKLVLININNNLHWITLAYYKQEIKTVEKKKMTRVDKNHIEKRAESVFVRVIIDGFFFKVFFFQAV